MRVTTRLISAIVGALLVIASAIALIELVLAALDRTPWLVDWRSAETFGQEHSWDDAAVRLIGLALLAAGIVLLVAVLRPRPPVTLDSHIGTGTSVVSIRRRPLERMAADVARSVDGIQDATARWDARSRRLAVRVSTRRPSVAGLEDPVGRRVDALLDAWRIDREPTHVVVRSTTPSGGLPPPPSREPASGTPVGSAPDMPTVEREGAVR